MTSRTATRRNQPERRPQANRRPAPPRRIAIIWAVAVVVVGAVLVGMVLTSRPTSDAATRTAPDFTLTDTSGTQVHLADFRGRTVLLYFSEGAGCGACIQQMAAIEKDKAAFDSAGITVLPIVMNSRDQIMRDMAAYGAVTPFLLDNGSVSQAYNVLGKGMHAGLPGHSFVLVDKSGVERWLGEYPSMWLSPSDLLGQVRAHLPG